MQILSVGSSSSGNSYIIATDEATIILDVGLAARRIKEALGSMGRGPEDVSAVLITHEHSDHIRSVRAVGRQCSNAAFYASRGTVDKVDNFSYIDDERINIVCSGESFFLGDCEIGTFTLSHDAAEPLGFTVDDGSEKLAVVTDCGMINDEIMEAVSDADILVFESNHDENMLLYGDYPYHLKLRIKSDHGHLSNASAGEALADLLEIRREENPDATPLKIMLAHLSFNNNAPFFARRTVEEILEARGFERERDYYLTIASKEELTYMSGAGSDTAAEV